MSVSFDEGMPSLTFEQVEAALKDMIGPSQSSSAELPEVDELSALLEKSSEQFKDLLDISLRTPQTFCGGFPTAEQLLINNEEPLHVYRCQDFYGTVTVPSDMVVNAFEEPPHNNRYHNFDATSANSNSMITNTFVELPHADTYQNFEGTVAVSSGMHVNDVEDLFHYNKCGYFDGIVGGCSGMDASAFDGPLHACSPQNFDRVVADISGITAKVPDEPSDSNRYQYFQGDIAGFSYINSNLFSESPHMYKFQDFVKATPFPNDIAPNVSNAHKHRNVDGGVTVPSCIGAITSEGPFPKKRCHNFEEPIADDNSMVVNEMKQKSGVVLSKAPFLGPTIVWCKACKQAFSSDIGLRTHEIQRDTIIVCNIAECKQTFCFQGSYKLHLSRFHKNCRFSCRKCKIRFDDKEQLVRHNCSHRRKWICHVCQTTYSSHKGLLRHRSTHK